MIKSAIVEAQVLLLVGAECDVVVANNLVDAGQLQPLFAEGRRGIPSQRPRGEQASVRGLVEEWVDRCALVERLALRPGIDSAGDLLSRVRGADHLKDRARGVAGACGGQREEQREDEN